MMFLWLFAQFAPAQACDDVAELPETTQVAWVSPLNRQVGVDSWIEVVRVQDLRAWLRAHSSDEVRLLQYLGMARRKPRSSLETRSHKITVFDVKSEWLCRPIDGATPGETVGGVSTCEDGQQRAISGHRKGYTGCGYAQDTAASTRGLDVYRVRWGDASAWGFCVLPLQRFLEEA